VSQPTETARVAGGVRVAFVQRSQRRPRISRLTAAVVNYSTSEAARSDPNEIVAKETIVVRDP
jgi:hypothetical protein